MRASTPRVAPTSTGWTCGAYSLRASAIARAGIRCPPVPPPAMSIVRRGGGETGPVPLIVQSADDLRSEHFQGLRDGCAEQELDAVLPPCRSDQPRAPVHRSRERSLATVRC